MIEVLKRNRSGAKVGELQKMLNFVADYYISIPNLVIDEKFGTKTEDAVRAFQNQFNLVPDGIVGEATWKKLFEVHNELKETTNEQINIKELEDTAKQDILNHKTIQKDFLKELNTNDILKIQKRLNLISKFYTSIPNISENNATESDLEIAINAFQKQFNLNQNKTFKSETFAKINEVYNLLTDEDTEHANNFNINYSQHLTPQNNISNSSLNKKTCTNNSNTNNNCYFNAPNSVNNTSYNNNATSLNKQDFFKDSNHHNFSGSPLVVGSRGESVKLMQTYLNNIKSIYPKIPTISASGVFGPVTYTAVRVFQAENKLTTNGVIDLGTWNAIINKHNTLT